MTSVFSIRNRSCIFLISVLLALSPDMVTGATVADNLWDENDVGSSLTNQQQDYSNLALGALSPGQLVAFEANKRNGIFNETLELAKAMKTCQAMAAAAYRLSKYVPYIQTKNQSEIWEGTVLKIVVKTLNQDVLARSMISKCFGRIRDLGIVIQNVYKIVRRSKGSKRGIALAKTSVPAALDRINDCIRSVEMLDDNVVAAFSNNTDTFVKLIGSEAANFTQVKLQCDLEIQKARDTQQALVTDLSIKKGEVERNHYLVTMTEKYVTQNKEELQEANRRVEEVYRLNIEVEKAINDIPQTVERFATTTERLCFGPFCARRTRSRPIQVPNPNRWAQERYYRDVIKSRVARLSKLETDEKSKRTVIEQLKMELSEYIRDYNRAVTELVKFQERFKTDYDAAEAAVRRALDKKDDIYRNASAIYEKIGAEGSMLIETLEHAQAFSKTLNPAATAYSPFAAILNTIKSLVEAHVGLLSSDEPSDVFLAGALLIEQAQFISDYVVGAQQILNSNENINGPAITEKPKQNLLA